MVKRRNQKGGLRAFFDLFGPGKSDEHKACVKKCDKEEETRQQQVQATEQSGADSQIPVEPEINAQPVKQRPVISESSSESSSAASDIASVGGYKRGFSFKNT